MLNTDNTYLTWNEWLDTVPFVKIFATITLGVVVAVSLNITNTEVSLVLLFLSLMATFLVKRYNSACAFLSLFMLGLTLPSLESENTPPINQNYPTQLVVNDTTTNRNIYIAEDLLTNSEMLFISDNRAKFNLGDTINATVICEPLSYAHFTLKRLTNNVREKYVAKAVDIASISLGVNYEPKAKTFIKRYNEIAEFRLRKMNISPDDIEVINGMVLGNREEITRSTKELFAASSLSHILAISGMHIGIIFMMINLLLFPLRRSFKGRVMAAIIAIIILWLYTLFVGAPISAVRATIMFTIMQVTLLRSYSGNQIYNTLFAVATIMLLADYKNLYDIGFQLSFVAVLSILIMTPILNSFLPRRNLITDIIVLTVGAQTLTTPIILYYFGNVSFVSIICNMIGSLTVMLIALLSAIYIIIPNIVVEVILKYTFVALRSILEAITSLPYSHLVDVEFDMIDITFYYIIIAIIINILKILGDKRKNMLSLRV